MKKLQSKKGTMTVWNTSNSIVRPMRKLLRDEDPEGLIRLGSPKDEYNIEADEITAALARHPPINWEDTFYIVWPIFKRWIGYKEDNSKAKTRYEGLSRKILKSIQPKYDTIRYKVQK